MGRIRKVEKIGIKTVLAADQVFCVTFSKKTINALYLCFGVIVDSLIICLEFSTATSLSIQNGQHVLELFINLPKVNLLCQLRSYNNYMMLIHHKFQNDLLYALTNNGLSRIVERHKRHNRTIHWGQDNYITYIR